jgi:hypothetical protein
MGVEMSAVGAVDGAGGIIFIEENGLHLAGFEGLQHAAQAGDSAAVGFGQLESLLHFCRTAFEDPLPQESAGVLANLFF